VSGGARPHPIETVNPNPSLHLAMDWLGVPSNTALPAGSYVDRDRYVGALGQFATRTAAYAYFEAKREIYRRFTPDQRLGYLFELHGSGDVTLRPEMDDFLVRAAHLFDDVAPQASPGDPRIARAVRRLADEMFGRSDAPEVASPQLGPAAGTLPAAAPPASPPSSSPPSPSPGASPAAPVARIDDGARPYLAIPAPSR
jgi:hypothetical protein